MDKLNILAVCDGLTSASSNQMRGLKKHSRHNIELCAWTPIDTTTEETDIVYFRYGGMVADNRPDNIEFMRQNRQIKYIGNINGFGVLRRWSHYGRFRDFVGLFDALTVLDSTYYGYAERMRIQHMVKPKIFLRPIGVDTEMFKPSPPPNSFCVGWAGTVRRISAEEGVLQRFLGLPFLHNCSAIGGKTGRKWADMPAFWNSISVFVELIEEPQPGGLMFLEAAASGRPVVAFESHVLDEWFPREWLVSSYEELVEKIETLRDDAQLYRETSEYFRRLAVEKRSWQVVAPQFDAMFESLMDN